MAQLRSGLSASEWRQEREQAHSDIMVEVAAALGQGAGAGAGMGMSVSELEEAVRAAAAAPAEETAGAGAAELVPEDDETDHRAGATEVVPDVDEADRSREAPAAEPAANAAQELGPGQPGQEGQEQGGAGERGPQAPPLVAMRNAAPRQHASLARTWCAKLGTVVAIQGAVQFLAGRVSFDEVALWRMQTASCAWHSGRWEEFEAGSNGVNVGHGPSIDWSQQRAGASRGARVLRFLTGAWTYAWRFPTPDSATVEARRDWSRDLHDDAFKIVAANSFIWNRALRPIIGIGMAQLLCAHCPKQLWAKTLLLAIPILRHPLKVVSMRLVCPGWPPPSFWQLILYTLDGSSKMSPMAGVWPKILSHLLVVQLRSFHLDEKMRSFFLYASASVRARVVRITASGRGEEAPAQEQPQRDGVGGRQQDVPGRDRGAQRGAVREGDRHLMWAMCEPLQRVMTAMLEELLVATISYPLVVLERRMCVDLNAPSNPFSLHSNLLYIYRLIRLEGWSALVAAYPEAMLVTVGKFSIYCTQLSIEEIVSRWFGPFGRLMLPAASAALAAGSNALRTMSSTHIKRAPWNSVLSVMLWMECGALASCYKQLGNHAVNFDQQTQRALRFWGLGGATSGEGRTRGYRLPLVRFRSEEARAQWFSTAYGSLDASARDAARLGPETLASDSTATWAERRGMQNNVPDTPTDAYLQRTDAMIDLARARTIASQDTGMIRSLGKPSLFSEAHSGSETFERPGNTKFLVSGWPSCKKTEGDRFAAGGLSTIVTQQTCETSSSKVVMNSCTGTELARTVWSLRTQQLRSPEFSRNLPLSLAIDPDDVLASSFALLEPLPAEVLLSRPIFVRFKGQIGSDWGGVRRAWMAKLASELFDPRLGLVIPCSVLSASMGVSQTGNITINPAPELLYTDQSASKIKTSREEKREEKRENLRAQLEGERRGSRDRDRERRRDTPSAQSNVGGRSGASNSDAGEQAAVAADTLAAATLGAVAAGDNSVLRAHGSESGDGSACAGDARRETGVRDEASESDTQIDHGIERSGDDISGGRVPGGMNEVAGQDASGVLECSEVGSSTATLAAAAAGSSASETLPAGEGAVAIGEDGESRDDNRAGDQVAVSDKGETKRGSSSEGAIKDKSITDRYLRFMGRVLGIAMLSGDPLGVNLDSAFFHSLMSREPLRIVLLGPPCCGKSLQCNLLASRCRLRHVTLDRLVRWHLTHNTREGKELKRMLRTTTSRVTSARVAAEGLLLALHPPDRAVPPAHGSSAASRSDGTQEDQALVRDEEKLFSKAQEIVLGMLKTRLAPRRRAGDKGWVLEGLPHCESLASALWDMDESCRPNLVIALHPTDQPKESKPQSQRYCGPLPRQGPEDSVAQPEALDGNLDARVSVDTGADAMDTTSSTRSMRASLDGVRQMDNPSQISCEDCGNDLDIENKDCSHCRATVPHAWPALYGDGDSIVRGARKSCGQCGAETQDDAGCIRCRDLLASCDAASVLESCCGSLPPEGVQTDQARDLAGHGDEAKLPHSSNTTGEHTRAAGVEAAGANAMRGDQDRGRERGQRVDENYKRHVLEKCYKRNVWGVLDFYYSCKVTCAMINRASNGLRQAVKEADESSMFRARTAHESSHGAMDDDVPPPTASSWAPTFKESRTDRHLPREEYMEAGAGRSWSAGGCAQGVVDEDGWVRVNMDGVAGESSAVPAMASGNMLAGGKAHQGRLPKEDKPVEDGSNDACRAHPLDVGGSREHELACDKRASYMSPPHLHKEIMRVVGLVQWGAPGVSEPGLAELAQTDPDEYEKLKRLVSMDRAECAGWLEEGDMPFTTTTKEARVAPAVGLPLADLSRLETAPLGGYTPQDRVTPETVCDYAALVCHRRMVEDVAHQMAQIRHGFEELAPRWKLEKLITARELEAVLVGSPDVDVSDWREHSVAKGFAASAPQVEWFWEVLAEASADTRLRILTWTTGLARAPLGGFAHMHLAFTLQCDPAPEHADRLPVAHTCGFQLDLPMYARKEVLCNKLLQAVQHVDFQIA